MKTYLLLPMAWMAGATATWIGLASDLNLTTDQVEMARIRLAQVMEDRCASSADASPDRLTHAQANAWIDAFYKNAAYLEDYRYVKANYSLRSRDPVLYHGVVVNTGETTDVLVVELAHGVIALLESEQSFQTFLTGGIVSYQKKDTQRKCYYNVCDVNFCCVRKAFVECRPPKQCKTDSDCLCEVTPSPRNELFLD